MNDQKIYSIEYERDGYMFSMRLLATLEEAEFHADSLGLSDPEEVIAIIPDMRMGLN